MGAVAELAAHPDELLAVVRYKLKARRATRRDQSWRRRQQQLQAAEAAPSADAEAWSFCYTFLGLVSRSFALVIQELHPELRDPVCVFYLVLRALDTIEDDTAADADARMRLCRAFYAHLDEGACRAEFYALDGYGYEHERALLQQFDKVVACYRALGPEYRRVIAHITQRMGEGMALHIHDTSCEAVADYDEYCHYVAGLVGVGLSAMFAASGFESRAEFVDAKNADTLSNSMGLFLQKTNIIRDYLEDHRDGRTFWPREIWSRFAPADDRTLGSLALARNRRAAVECLNAMVTDALQRVPDCLRYMIRVRDPAVFNFVAIPQVMAVATLALCYNNAEVFERRVKLRRGLTAKLVMRTRGMRDVTAIFAQYVEHVARRADPCDPSYAETVAAAERALNAVAEAELELAAGRGVGRNVLGFDLTHLNRVALVLFAGLSWYVLYRRKQQDEALGWRAGFGGIPSVGDMAAIGLLFFVMTYLLSFFGLQYVNVQQAVRK